MKGKLALLTSVFAAVLMLAFAAGTLAAKPKDNPSRTFSLPETARKVAPNVYYLGSENHNGRLAEGYAFVDNRGKNAKPGTECGNDICEPGENANKCPADCGGGGEDPGDPTGTESCYGFLAKGAKWKTVEPWVINSEGSNLDSAYVLTNLSSNIGKWENAAVFDILGTGTSTNQVLEADTVSMDDKNEVYFADITQDGAVGVTIIWGYFRGNPAWRELLEWDQVYDNVDYRWSQDCGAEDCLVQGSEKMDFEDVSTHELGHSVGLDDLYDTACSTVTMYGFVGYGETHSRSLEDGDINGVTQLYN